MTVNINAVADDGSASDGPAGARDNVRGDVENLTGSPLADSLTGNGSANVLTALGGADSVFGLGGVDQLQVRDGVTDTRVACGAQADMVTADTGDPADADCETVNRP